MTMTDSMNSQAHNGVTLTVAHARQAPEIFIRATDVSVRYGRRAAIQGATAAFRADGITALVGPSGCGKTTFLKCINRMIDCVDHARVEGSIEIDGRQILDTSIDTRALRRRVGMIFQQPNPFALSIRENVALPLREHRIGTRQDQNDRIEHVLRRVGLWDEVADRLDESAISLSGGQRQRLCIARAISLEPDVLLMDEPCSSLDPIASGVVESLISELATRYTILIVTHNLAQAQRIADEVVVFWVRDGVGAIIEQQETEALFSDPREPETQAYVAGRCC